MPGMENLGRSQGFLFERVRGFCLTCQQSRYVLYCVDCVRKGNFTSSSRSNKDGQSYSMKKLNRSTLEERWHKLEQEVLSACTARREVDQLQELIYRTRISLKWNRDLSRNLDEELIAKQEILARKREEFLQDETADLQRRTRVSGTISVTDQCNETLSSRTDEICKSIVEQVRLLRASIFPIESPTNSVATKWLPDKASYQHLLHWIKQYERRECPTNHQYVNEVIGQPHEGLRAAVGLMNLTQLVNVLAFYLDLNLPYELNFHEFTIERLTAERLANGVARLSTNVVFMCASQRMDQNQIEPQEVSKNTLRLLDSIELHQRPYGKTFELNPQLQALLETAFSRSLRLFDANVEAKFACGADGRRNTLADSNDTSDDDDEIVFVPYYEDDDPPDSMPYN